MLKDLGYTIDCSYVPHVSFRADGGPDYRGTPDQPFWLDADKALLEIPLTSGFYGALSAFAPKAAGLFDSPSAARLSVPGILSRLRLATRSRLTPEGVPAEEQRRLLDAMVKSGRRFFTLTYHSPSLPPATPHYVRDEADLTAFLSTIPQVLRHFRDELGGEFTTLTRYAAAL